MSMYEEITGKKKKKKEQEKFVMPDWMKEEGNKNAQVKKENESTWLKSSLGTEKIKNIWSDGYQIGDITATILGAKDVAVGTAKDIATNVGKGFMSTVEGAVDAGRYLIGGATKKSAEIQADIWDFLGNNQYASNLRRAGQQVYDFEKKNAMYDVTGNLLGEKNDIFKSNWSKQVDTESVFGNKMDSVSQGVGNVGAFIGLSGISPLLGGSELGAVGTFANSFASAYGNTRTEAYKNGADDKTAHRSAFISGLAEGISEQFFSGIPGMKTAGWGDALSGKIGKSVSKFFGSKAGKVALTMIDGLGEGTEEILSNMFNAIGTDIMHYLDENYTYGMEDMSGNVLKDTKDAIFSQDSLDSFISAMLTSVITGGGKSLLQNVQTNQASKQVQNLTGQTKQQVNELINQIAEKRVNLELDEKANYKERTEVIDNEKMKLANEFTELIKQGKQIDLEGQLEGLVSRENYIKAVGAGQASSKGMDLNESYRAYNGDAKYSKQIANIQKFMNNRNIDARFDATMFDNNEQNAIWTTQDGKDNVIFNPNASQDQVIQNIATHEMTHDIINQKTEAGTSLFNDVLENIKSQENYAKDRQEIEDLYAKYYDRNSEDFSAKVDEEMVANELGKNLGTQEYINRLVNEKPNLAKRIYNWVVDKLDNIGKSEEYKEQKAYWKSVADKFEKAYNEQKTATGEDKTAYSILKNKKEYNLGAYQYGLSKTDDSYKYNKVYAYDIENGGKGDNVQVSVTPTGYVWNNALLSDSIKGKGEGTKIALDLNQQSIEETGYPLRSLPEYNVVGTKNHTEEGKGLWESLVRKDYAVKNNDNSYTMLETAPTEQQTTTRYSLTKDNTGRELSEGQKEYFKNSKAVDDDGNLVTVYHTMTDKGVQFNEFNPVGTVGYKFGDQVVNFYTNSKIMSDSYSDYKSKKADTSKLNNINDAKKWIQAQKTILSEYDIKDLGKDGYSLTENGQSKRYFKNENDLLKNLKQTFYTYNKQFGGDKGQAKYQYEGYVNITNPYIVEANEANWDNIITGYDEYDVKALTNLSADLKEQLIDLANESIEFEKNASEEIMKYQKLMGEYAQEHGGYTNARKTSEYFRDLEQKLWDAQNTYNPNGTLFEDSYFTKNGEELLEKVNNETNSYFNPIDVFNSAKNNFEESALKDIFSTKNTTNEIIQDVLNKNKNGANYDGVVIKKVMDYGSTTEFDDTGAGQDVYVTFNSNQFKAVDNLNPTEDADIRYSMQQDVEPETPGTRTTMGELFNEIAPIREDLSNITEQMNNLSNQIETMQESLENASKGYVETYNEQRNENIPTRNLTEEDANTLQDALMNDEGYLRSLDEQANQIPDNSKLVDKLTKEVTIRLDLDKSQKETLRNIINDSIANEYSADEISQALQREFSEMSYDMTNQEAIEAKKLIRDIPIKVSNTIKTDIADYGKWKQSNFGKINFSNKGGPVDTVYMELSDKMPYFFPSDIVNPTDQLLKIAEVANMATKVTETFDIDADEFDNIADYIKNTQLEDEYNAQMQSDYDLGKNIQFDMNEDIVPTTIRTQDSIDEFIENRDIAPVKPDKTQQRQERAEQRSKAYRIYREMISNRNAVIDDYSRATGNKEIKFKGDKWNSSQSEANFNISNKQTDINGNWIGKGLDEIFKPIEDAGLGRAFDDYLFNKSNIERHNVGKGSVVPVEVSRQLVAQYERENPNFKSTAEEVYKFIDNYSKEQVDSGILAKEKYDDFRGEFGIYGDYVPFRIENFDKNRYYDDSGEAKAVSTFKRSKGGASDLSELMGMKDAIANQVRASKGAIAFNELAKEIVQTNGRDNEIFDVDTRTDITNTSDSLLKTEDGDYILSAYINGEKVSTKISEELYNELSRANEDRIKQLEKDFSVVTNPLQKMSSWRREILTSKNPAFLLRNFFKDAGDAVINSKYTKDMMANYAGLTKGHKPAVIELAQAKTKTAQRFLAQYGVDGTWGDYSNISKSKSVFNKIAKANQLVELAPRYSEYLASLQNGCSEAEALYNAREVTTNFGRGGYITKALNRNGFTFLNANVQGLSKLVRNLSGENGVKGVASVVVKGALFAVIPSILNHILYGLGDDKDEEYEALPDYIKDNYFLIKTKGNKFVRIPKGRVNAVFGSLARRMIEAGEGEGFDAKEWAENAWSQIGVGDSSGIQTIFTPLRQAFGSKNGEAWYGGDIVPTRLQNKPAGEQTDASIDAVSNFIGEKTGLSPYKINYVLDQYSGAFGDIILPMITPETSSGAEKPSEYLLAPIKDSFVVNSTDDNKYAGDFYDLKDKLEIQKNSEKATTEDKVKYKYMSGVSKEMSELYKERREVQADTTLGKKEKYEKVQIIQNEINNLAKEALSNYQNISSSDNYSNVGDKEYYKDSKGEWTEVKEDEQEFTAGMTNAEKDLYYNTKNKISGISEVYSAKLNQLSKNDPKKTQLYADKKEDITRAIVNSGLDNQTKAMVYSKYYSNKDTMTNVVNAGYNVDTYITALNDIEQIRNKYSQKKGYTTEQRKAKTIAYINSLNMEIPQKAMLVRQYYKSFRDYNNDIVNFVGNLNIPYEDKKAILEDTGMTVKGNNVSWK